MTHIYTPSMKQRLCAAITAGTLAISTMGAPLAAFADPAAEETQTGTGATGVYVQVPESVANIGGTEDTENNPDGDDDDKFGDNLAFTVPTTINFVAKANGELIGPEAEVTYIENESAFRIHVSSMRVESNNSWTITKDVNASGETDANSFDFTFGPADAMLNAANYLSKKPVANKPKWQMEYGKKSATAVDDRVQLNTAGHIARVSKDLTEKEQIATIHTYVTQGTAPTE